MDPVTLELVVIALGSYLLGSIPFGYILVKLFLKQDIRTTGSGNIGATNVARSGKKGLAIATLLLDAGKGALAATAAMVLTPHDAPVPFFVAVACLASILGHCFPVWLRFRGGKGVATAVGAFSVLSPMAILVAIVCFSVTFAFSRYVSLSSVLSAAVFPAALFSLWPSPRIEARGLVLSLVVLCSALIILKHHANIRRLIAGTEPKFGKKAIGTADPIQTEKNA